MTTADYLRAQQVPALPDRLVGREDLLERVLGVLSSSTRLVTLFGPGGVGKTRLAMEVASRYRASEGGSEDKRVAFSELASERTSQEMQAAVAELFGADTDALKDVLRVFGRGLLVLDNVEQLVEQGCAALIAEWLQELPQLRILATSRHLLRIRGELVIEVEPLSTRSGGPAAQLFVDRANALPQVGVEANDPAVARVVELTEGVPLAIEIAAAQLDVLDLDGLIDALESTELTLKSVDRDVPDRHRSLKRVVETSLELISPAAKTAFGQLSIFSGSFDLSAAQGVLGQEITDRLRELVNASLIRRTGRRFAFLESVQAFARDLLQQSTNATSIRQRHHRYYADLVQQLNRKGKDMLQELQDDRENLLSIAHDALLEDARVQDVRDALSILPGLVEVMLVRGPLEQMLEIIGVLIDRASGLTGQTPANETRNGVSRPDDVQSATILLQEARWLRGRVLGVMGQVEASAIELEQLLTEGVADPLVRARARASRARLGVQTAKEESRALSLAVSDLQELGAVRDEARVRSLFGSRLFERGQLKSAKEQFVRALTLHKQAADQTFEAIAWNHLGLLEQEAGQWEAAQQHFETALTMHREVGNKRFEGIAMADLAGLQLEMGHAQDAQHGFEEAILLLERVGDRRLALLAHTGLAAAQAGAGGLETASATLSDVALQLKGDELLAICHRLAAGHLDVARALKAIVQGDTQTEKVLTSRVESLLQEVGREIEEQNAPDEARLAHRQLASARQGLTDSVDGVVVSKDGKLATADGQPVNLEAREQLQKVLVALGQRRDRSPGAPCSPEELFADAWPGESIRTKSALNRVRVAVSALRKAGLREVLLTRDGGYLLDPEVPFRWLASNTQAAESPASSS